MGQYRKVDVRIWNDAKFRGLSDKAKLVFFLLMTHPNMTMLGAMRHSAIGLAVELGWSPEAFGEAFREALREGMVEYDEKASCIVLPNFLKYNRPESPNVVKSWPVAFDFIPECELKNQLFQRLKAFVEGLTEAFPKAFREAFPKDYAKDYGESGTGTGTGTGFPPNPPGGTAGVDPQSTRRVPRVDPLPMVDDGENISPLDLGRAVMNDLGISGRELLQALETAIRKEARSPDFSVSKLRKRMCDAWTAYLKAAPSLRFTFGPEKFFGGGTWADQKTWPWKDETMIPKPEKVYLNMPARPKVAAHG